MPLNGNFIFFSAILLPSPRHIARMLIKAKLEAQEDTIIYPTVLMTNDLPTPWLLAGEQSQ